jgi:hypothetical protein
MHVGERKNAIDRPAIGLGNHVLEFAMRLPLSGRFVVVAFEQTFFSREIPKWLLGEAVNVS